MRRLGAAALVALLVGACGVVPGFGPQMVNGWSIGAEMDCAERVPPRQSCDELVAMAASHAGLEAGTPGRIYREGSYTAPDGRQILSNRSGGGMYVVVLELAGGERRTVGMFCGIGECRAGGGPVVRP